MKFEAPKGSSTKRARKKKAFEGEERLTGRANAITRGKGKKLGLKKIGSIKPGFNVGTVGTVGGNSRPGHSSGITRGTVGTPGTSRSTSGITRGTVGSSAIPHAGGGSGITRGIIGTAAASTRSGHGPFQGKTMGKPIRDFGGGSSATPPSYGGTKVRKRKG